MGSILEKCKEREDYKQIVESLRGIAPKATEAYELWLGDKSKEVDRIISFLGGYGFSTSMDVSQYNTLTVNLKICGKKFKVGYCTFDTDTYLLLAFTIIEDIHNNVRVIMDEDGLRVGQPPLDLPIKARYVDADTVKIDRKTLIDLIKQR